MEQKLDEYHTIHIESLQLLNFYKDSIANSMMYKMEGYLKDVGKVNLIHT